MAGLHLTLSPELETRLRTEAAQRHISAEKLAESLLQDGLNVKGEAGSAQRVAEPDASEAGGHNALMELHDMIREAFKDVPEEEWNRLPPDLGAQLDHYLYGTPKR